MKIGILTFHDVENYGSQLQAYALKETIKSMGHDAQIVNYKQPYIVSRNKGCIYFDTANVKSFIGSLIYNIGDARNRWIKTRKFKQFRTDYLDLTEEYTSSPQIKGKDAYIVGSDVVWSSLNTRFDTTYFLDFCTHGERKISYAASIGKEKITEEEAAFLRDNINNIDHISVREKSAVDILKSFTDKDITQVLDPTLLADAGIWDKLIIPQNHMEPYLLLYRVTSKKNVFQVADYVAQKLQLKVLYINNTIKRVPYRFKKVKRVGPLEFLTLFKNASFIVTNSFHGTAFSLIFRKNFITVPTIKSVTRMQDLLTLLKLDDRLIENPAEIRETYPYEIDYTVPAEILARERARSLTFLKNAIEGQ